METIGAPQTPVKGMLSLLRERIGNTDVHQNLARARSATYRMSSRAIGGSRRDPEIPEANQIVENRCEDERPPEPHQIAMALLSHQQDVSTTRRSPRPVYAPAGWACTQDAERSAVPAGGAFRTRRGSADQPRMCRSRRRGRNKPRGIPSRCAPRAVTSRCGARSGGTPCRTRC